MKKELKTVCDHKNQGPKTYIAWHNWAEKQWNDGRRQKQCVNCKLWIWDETANTTGTKNEST